MTWATAYASKDITQTQNNLFGYNGVLTGTETDSGDIPVGGAVHLSFHVTNALTTDYFKLQAKLTNDDTYSDVEITAGAGVQIKDAKTYAVDITGVMFIKFLRVGTADGSSGINLTIMLPRGF